jgi:hypothetical protein
LSGQHCDTASLCEEGPCCILDLCFGRIRQAICFRDIDPIWKLWSTLRDIGGGTGVATILLLEPMRWNRISSLALFTDLRDGLSDSTHCSQEEESSRVCVLSHRFR